MPFSFFPTVHWKHAVVHWNRELEARRCAALQRPGAAHGQGTEHPIGHLGPKNLSQTGGLELYLFYGRPKQIPNLMGKTDHNVEGLAYILN